MLRHDCRDANQVGLRLALSDVVKLVLCIPYCEFNVSAVSELFAFLLDVARRMTTCRGRTLGNTALITTFRTYNELEATSRTANVSITTKFWLHNLEASSGCSRFPKSRGNGNIASESDYQWRRQEFVMGGIRKNLANSYNI